jgi:protein CpxP
MRRQLLTGVIGILTAAALAGAVHWSEAETAGEGGPGGAIPGDRMQARRMGPERHPARMAEVLGLSDAQKEQVKAILQAEREKTAPLRQAMGESQKQLRQAMRAATIDEAAIRTIVANQAQLRAELIISRARMRSQIHALLTPEQRTLAEKLQPLLERGPGRHPRWHGEAPPLPR